MSATYSLGSSRASGPWWLSPWGVGTGEGARPLPAGGDTANPPPRPASGLLPRPLGGRGQCPGVPRGKPCPGLITSRSEPVGLSSIASNKDQDRFPKRWTIDRRAANFRLLNWTVSSRVSIPNVSAYGVSPSPHEARPTKLLSPGRGQVRGDARVWRRDSRVARTDENRSVIASIECIENRCPVEHFALF